MSWPSAIVLIVLIAAAAKVLRARYHSEAFLDRHGSEQRAAIERPERDYRRDDEAEAEISALKERIAVLERIAYDKNSVDAPERARISAEIDALREEQD